MAFRKQYPADKYTRRSWGPTLSAAHNWFAPKQPYSSPRARGTSRSTSWFPPKSSQRRPSYRVCAAPAALDLRIRRSGKSRKNLAFNRAVTNDPKPAPRSERYTCEMLRFAGPRRTDAYVIKIDDFRRSARKATVSAGRRGEARWTDALSRRVDHEPPLTLDAGLAIRRLIGARPAIADADRPMLHCHFMGVLRAGAGVVRAPHRRRRATATTRRADTATVRAQHHRRRTREQRRSRRTQPREREAYHDPLHEFLPSRANGAILTLLRDPRSFQLALPRRHKILVFGRTVPFRRKSSPLGGIRDNGSGTLRNRTFLTLDTSGVQVLP